MPRWISKSKLMRGFQCLKSIYLTIHEPQLATPVTPEQQLRFDVGREVGEEARRRFPGGTLIDNEPWDFLGSLRRTRELLNQGVGVLYEAAFEYQGCFARLDIITRSPETGKWTVYEVKSSTQVREEHYDDVGLQAYIAANSGLPIERICVVHLNRECRFPNLKNLFSIVDVTEALRERYRSIGPRLNDIFHTVRQTEAPVITMGDHCDKPYECVFKAHCASAAVGQQLSLTGEEPPQGPVASVRVVDQNGIRSALSTWRYPLVYLDFETMMYAIPRFRGMRPYDQLPFQFSVHIQNEPGGELTHVEFLHEGNDDPRPALIDELLKSCAGDGSIVSYYAKFESDRIRELAQFSQQHANALLKLVERMVDPLPILRAYVQDPDFAGSYSLKVVAPVLLGEQASYAHMMVGDGSMAQVAYHELLQAAENSSRRSELREALLRYCEKDTRVMVDLVEWCRQQAAAASDGGSCIRPH